MPKRVIDGEALWKSRKLKSVAAQYRSHYANWLPMANYKGVFEAGTDSIWATVYAFLMPDVTEVVVADILAEFERCGLVVVWDAGGRRWGYFVGIEKAGRLPPLSHYKRYSDSFPDPPKDIFEYKKDESGITPIDSQGVIPQGTGTGTGTGLGTGLGGASDDIDLQVREIAALYPKISDPLHLSQEVAFAIGEAVIRHGYDAVLAGTKNTSEWVRERWPKGDLPFLPGAPKFFRESEYLKDPETLGDRRKSGKPSRVQEQLDARTIARREAGLDH